MSLKASTDVFLWEKACGDSFPSFALKIHMVCKDVMSEPVKDRVTHIKDLDVRYKGTTVVRNLLLGAFKYVDVVDVSTHELVLKFERRFGKEVFTDKWNSMTRILQQCSRAAETCAAMWGTVLRRRPFAPS